MNQRIELKSHFTAIGMDPSTGLTFFVLINLGLIESLANGLMSATEAVVHFYFADNCLFVNNYINNRTAHEIMSHGVQLPDLFNCLSAEEAQREFLHELSVMRKLCLQLLDNKRHVA